MSYCLLLTKSFLSVTSRCKLLNTPARIIEIMKTITPTSGLRLGSKLPESLPRWSSQSKIGVVCYVSDDEWLPVPTIGVELEARFLLISVICHLNSYPCRKWQCILLVSNKQLFFISQIFLFF